MSEKKETKLAARYRDSDIPIECSIVPKNKARTQNPSLSRELTANYICQVGYKETEQQQPAPSVADYDAFSCRGVMSGSQEIYGPVRGDGKVGWN
ncbi:MAG: hypothetical protein Q9160_002266 [Pyrenula sp. 1 TL-2023]